MKHSWAELQNTAAQGIGSTAFASHNRSAIQHLTQYMAMTGYCFLCLATTKQLQDVMAGPCADSDKPYLTSCGCTAGDPAVQAVQFCGNVAAEHTAP